MTIADPYSNSAIAPLMGSVTIGVIGAGFLRNPYLIIGKYEVVVPVVSPYAPPSLISGRQAAIDQAIAVMDEPIEIMGELRRFSRDEMHEPR